MQSAQGATGLFFESPHLPSGLLQRTRGTREPRHLYDTVCTCYRSSICPVPYARTFQIKDLDACKPQGLAARDKQCHAQTLLSVRIEPFKEVTFITYYTGRTVCVCSRVCSRVQDRTNVG